MLSVAEECMLLKCASLRSTGIWACAKKKKRTPSLQKKDLGIEYLFQLAAEECPLWVGLLLGLIHRRNGRFLGDTLGSITQGYMKQLVRDFGMVEWVELASVRPVGHGEGALVLIAWRLNEWLNKLSVPKLVIRRKLSSPSPQDTERGHV